MCIKIFNENLESSYDPELPLESQVNGNEKIVINFDPADASINKFIKDIQRCAKTGTCQNLTVDVIHNNNVFGMKVRNTIKKAVKDLTVNDLIKTIVKSYSEADNKLSEMSKKCTGGVCE